MKKIKYNKDFETNIEIQEDIDFECLDNIIVTITQYDEKDNEYKAKFILRKIMSEKDEPIDFVDVADSQTQSFYNVAHLTFTPSNSLLINSALKSESDSEITSFYYLDKVTIDHGFEKCVLQASLSKLLKKLNKGMDDNSWACVSYSGVTFFEEENCLDKKMMADMMKELGFRSLPKSLTPGNQLFIVGGNTLNTNLVYDKNYSYETEIEKTNKKKLSH